MLNVKRKTKGGQNGGLSLLTAKWNKLFLRLLVRAQTLRSLLPDGSRSKGLCDGRVGVTCDLDARVSFHRFD